MSAKYEALLALADRLVSEESPDDPTCICRICRVIRELRSILKMPDDPAPPLPTGRVVRMAVAWRVWDDGSMSYEAWGRHGLDDAYLKHKALHGLSTVGSVEMATLRLPEPADLVAEVEP